MICFWLRMLLELKESISSLPVTIKISGTTPVDGIEISSACSAAAINLTGANADGVLISGANTTAGISITGAEVDGIVISTSTPVIGISITSLCETGISIAASSTMGIEEIGYVECTPGICC